ncbi:MAG: YlbF family regulator, partial [Clostridia bacterium]|nr:YlbF family regulator [Clostridia bacterium]
MDIIKLTRELGKAIQADERYAKFVTARETNEKDDELNDLIGKMQLVHMSYQHEASK